MESVAPTLTLTSEGRGSFYVFQFNPSSAFAIDPLPELDELKTQNSMRWKNVPIQ